MSSELPADLADRKVGDLTDEQLEALAGCLGIKYVSIEAGDDSAEEDEEEEEDNNGWDRIETRTKHGVVLRLGRATADRIISQVTALQDRDKQNALYARLLGLLYEELGGLARYEVFVIPDADNPIIRTGIRKTGDGWILVGTGFGGESLDPPASAADAVGTTEGSSKNP